MGLEAVREGLRLWGLGQARLSSAGTGLGVKAELQVGGQCHMISNRAGFLV